MGAASYREDDLNRFLANTDPPLGPFPPPPKYVCPFCAAPFEASAAFSLHLAESHSGKRPILLIGGTEPAVNEIIRQPIPKGHVTLENWTSLEVRRNDRLIPNDDLATLLSQETFAIIDIRMENGPNNQAAPLTQYYRLTFEAPSKAGLDEVDRKFRSYFAAGLPTMSEVTNFLAEPCCQGVAHGYANALGGYVRSVLVKDQAAGTGVTLRPAEANGFMMEALEYLRRFDRPVARVVCGYARFCRNDFSGVAYPTGSDRLDRTNALLASKAGRAPAQAPSVSQDRALGPMIGICPIDQVTDRILDLADRLARQTRWGQPLEEECRRTVSDPTFNPEDAVKVRMLWAVTALRLGQDEAAREPLAQLCNTYPFAAWAEAERNRIEGVMDV